jgi:hypothetical protein
MKRNKSSVSESSPASLTSRRYFLRESAVLAALTTANPFPGLASLHEREQPSDSMIGIQIGAVSFVDEGVENVLDNIQKRGRVNTIFLTTFTYGRGLSGRQIPGHPFPNHGSQESDEKTFHGGNYATIHPEFYQNTVLNNTRATEFGDLDIVAAVLPAARKRAMKIFCSVEDQWRPDVPGVSDCAEIDLYGRKTNALCLFNPDVRSFWTGLVTDLCTSYNIDGILFFNERNGPLLNALGASHFQQINSSRVTCFCEHHQRAALQQGINFERAKQGYQKLDRLVQSSLKGERPNDGYFVEFQRLLLQYPEIIAWDRLFDQGKHEVLGEVYATVKSISEDLQVGFHIEHVNSFNPFFRATRSYEEIASKADFLKVVTYNNCGGERYVRFIRNVCSTVFRDVPPQELMQFNNHLLNYDNEASFDQLQTTGLSPDYISRETRRALEGVRGRCLILPGIDIGIPTGPISRKASPNDTYAATLAALRAGANGVIFSRKYSEMKLENLDAAGRAVREALKH